MPRKEHSCENFTQKLTYISRYPLIQHNSSTDLQKNLPRKTLAKLRNWAGVLQLGGGPFSSACTGSSRLLDDAPGGPCTLKSGQGGRPSHARPTNYTLAPASPMQAPLGARHRCWPPGALGSQMPHGHSNHTPAPRCCPLVSPN